MKPARNPNLQLTRYTATQDRERDRAPVGAMSNEDLDGQELLAARTQLLEELQERGERC